MKCPNCRLENPPDAQVCDCGYSFESAAMPTASADAGGRPSDGVKEKYRKRRLRQIVIGVALVPVLFVTEGAFAVSQAATSTALRYVGLGFLAIAVAVSLVNWRCPACGRYLGRRITQRHCHHCGVELR